MSDKKRKHFSELSEDEVLAMSDACMAAAVEYANKINMGGLSEVGSHNIYTTLQLAIRNEWIKRASKSG